MNTCRTWGRLSVQGLLVVLIGAGSATLAAVPAHATDTTHASARTRPPEITIRLTDAPADRVNDPRARVYIVDHVAPGTTFTRHVQVTNNTPQSRVLSFYAGPAVIRHDAWTPAAPGARSDLTSWISTGEPTFTLPPGGSRTEPVTITVPKDASAGERYGVLWASTTSTGTGNVRLVSRVGVRVYLSVSAGGEPVTSFALSNLRGTRAHGQTRVLVAVRNTGGRAVDLQGKLWLTNGPGGISAGPFDTDKGTTLAPGESGTLVTRLPKSLPEGPWKATQRAWSGTTTRAISGPLNAVLSGIAIGNLGTDPGSAPPPSEAGLQWSWLWLLPIVPLLALWWRRRRHHEDDPSAPGAPGAPVPAA